MNRKTAPYLLTRIGPDGPDERGALYVLGPKIGPSYSELRAENERLRLYLEAARGDVAGWSQMWHDEVQLRIGVQCRLNRAMRVLASLGRLSPRMAALVSVARKDVWRA